MEYIILLIFSFFTEAVILWQYAASLFSPSHSLFPFLLKNFVTYV